MDIQDMHDIKNTSGFENSTVENFRVIFADGSESDAIEADLQLIEKTEGSESVDVEVLDSRKISGGSASEIIGDREVIGYKLKMRNRGYNI